MSKVSAARSHGLAPRRGVARRLGVAFAATALLPACFTFTHTVGRGPVNPQQPVAVTETRWFALYGIVPLGEFDSASLAGSARDYRVTTKFTFMDCLITTFTSLVTFYRQTVIVEK
jgi:hypothetical protein